MSPPGVGIELSSLLQLVIAVEDGAPVSILAVVHDQSHEITVAEPIYREKKLVQHTGMAGPVEQTLDPFQVIPHVEDRPQMIPRKHTSARNRGGLIVQDAGHLGLDPRAFYSSQVDDVLDLTLGDLVDQLPNLCLENAPHLVGLTSPKAQSCDRNDVGQVEVHDPTFLAQ